MDKIKEQKSDGFRKKQDERVGAEATTTRTTITTTTATTTTVVGNFIFERFCPSVSYLRDSIRTRWGFVISV